METENVLICHKGKLKKLSMRLMMAATDDNDDVTGNVFKLRGEEGLRIITQLLNIKCETGEWPKDFKEVK